MKKITLFFMVIIAILLASKPVFAQEVIPVPTPGAEAADQVQDYNDNRSWVVFPYRQFIAKTASKYAVDPQIIYATIMTESEGDVYAYRYEPHLDEASLCMGQILVSTAKRLGLSGDPSNMYDPEVCIDLIGRYHRAMLDDYGDLTPAQLAAAYNAGSPYKRAVPGHIARFTMWYNETVDSLVGSEPVSLASK